jgi:predicted lipid-binding transport protein (Tim44 family)
MALKMQNNLPYIDILIFGIIAVFLIYRLKNILGTKTGFEKSNINEKKQDKQFNNVVSLKSEKNDLNNKELNDILNVDPNFNINDFLSGSENFFKMVLESFVSGNLENIKNFTKPSVLKSFKTAIDERNSEQETLIIDLKSIKENKITKAKITRSSIKLNVIFETFQVRALLDKNDKIIDGDNENEILVKDEWVFERKVNDNNPNWTLVETKSN